MSKRLAWRLGALCALWLLTATVACSSGPEARPDDAPDTKNADAEPPLIERDVLFGNPERTSVRISPDGQRISFLAPIDGVLNIWVGPVDQPDQAKPVTQDKGRGIRSYSWAYTNEHLLYSQDKDGDENWRIYAAKPDGSAPVDLTPLDKVAARINYTSPQKPDEIVVAINDRDARLHDIYTINVRTAERTLLETNPGYAGFVINPDHKAAMGIRMTPDGGSEYLVRDAEETWVNHLSIPMEDTLTTRAVGFGQDNNTLYMLDSRGRDKAALFEVKLDGSAEPKLVGESPKADINRVMTHPMTRKLEAYAFTYMRRQWVVLDDAIKADFEALAKVNPGELHVVSRSLDDSRWVVAFEQDNGPIEYYAYQRDTKVAKRLFSNRPALEGLPLTRMHPVSIKARDGMELVSYLSLPSWHDKDGRPDQALPTVLLVHGGPWGRDSWGYSSMHQWLANRGYAVLSVNFRGSTGFGKDFINAANLQWGKTMHDDLLDAVKWMVDQKIAQPDKVAIMGGSYGGYAALAGLTFSPQTFACAVDIVGPSNLITLLESIPPYWAPLLEMFAKRVGDPRTEEGRALLTERSPLTHVDKIVRPLLIGQGANDPRVTQAESDQIVEAMNTRQIPVTYVLYPDEGHGFARPPNRLSFFAITEAFLKEHLGGRVQPFGDDFKGSSLKVLSGETEIEGLKTAFEAHMNQAQP